MKRYRQAIAILVVVSLFTPQIVVAGSSVQAGTDNGTETITPGYYVSPEIIPSIFTDSTPSISQYQFEAGIVNASVEREWFTENLSEAQNPVAIINGTATQDSFEAFVASVQIPEALPVPTPSSDEEGKAEEQRGEAAAQTLSHTAQSVALNNIKRDPIAVRINNVQAGAYKMFLATGDGLGIAWQLGTEIGRIIEHAITPSYLADPEPPPGELESAGPSDIIVIPSAVTGTNFSAGADGAIVAEKVSEVRGKAAAIDAQLGELESDLQVSVKALAGGNRDQVATEAHARNVGSVLIHSQRLRQEALAKQYEAFDTLFRPRWEMNPADRTPEGDLIAAQAHQEAIQAANRSERLLLDASMTLGRLAAKTGEPFFGVLPPEPFGGGPVKPTVTEEAQAYFTAANLFNVSPAARDCGCKMVTRNVDLRASESSVTSPPGVAGSIASAVMKPADTVVRYAGGDNVYEENPIASRIGEGIVRGLIVFVTGGASLGWEVFARAAGGYVVEKLAEATGISQALADAAKEVVDSSMAFAASREITVREISNVLVPNDAPAEGELIGFGATDNLEPLAFSSGGGSGWSAAAPDYAPPSEVLDDLEDNPRSYAPRCSNICSGQGITTKPENSYFVGPQACSSAPYGSCNNVVFYTGWLCNPGFIQNSEGTECLPIVQASDPPEVTLTANPGSVLSGESSTLSWTIANVSSCDAGGGWSGAKSSPSGSETLSNITETRVYTLTCTNAHGTATATTTVVLADEDFVLSSVGRLSMRGATGQNATSTSVTIKLSPMNGFSDPVSLSASLTPTLDGFGYTYGDPSLSESEYDRGSSFEVYFPTGNIQRGYTVTVTGTSGALVRTLNLPLSLAPVQPIFEEF